MVCAVTQEARGAMCKRSVVHQSGKAGRVKRQGRVRGRDSLGGRYSYVICCARRQRDRKRSAARRGATAHSAAQRLSATRRVCRAPLGRRQKRARRA
eukprot:scaffold102_cov133-Isochrysis_galbana.AAC.12